MGTARNTDLVIGEPKASRRFRSKGERRLIAEESLQPGISAAVVARRHGVNANQVFQWRKLLREGLLGLQSEPAQFLPVRVAALVNEAHQPARQYSGTIRIEAGRTRICIEGAVDPGNLRAVLEHLGR